MNELQIFKHDGFGEIRTLEINGEPWFVGKDVTDILGYQNGSRDINRHVDEEDKLTRGITDSGQSRQMYVINESGLYSLILSSKLPQAKAFKRWVTSEVLPTIRKHGLYAVNEILENPDMVIAALTKLKEERELRKTLELENTIKDQQIAELKPKADYLDTILQSKSLMTITQIAKDYGMSGNAMNKILRQLGVQYKQSGQWFLYSKYHHLGYTSSETVDIVRSDGKRDVKMNTKWTLKGRIFLYDLLKEHDILPMIEKEVVA